ncbi:MAG: bifunctional (p)ppGpp synthetase/guanosine-3',5'-bis(diphosphate) 3'-pyrophosphohydrolase, partial [Chloroflexi bacterium]|nr:bifunctional (p)ppGpp synthetase/guanosine-3',5'-bis(diphosphate) 3'-pyrophosphohydrolase [Chloroflexota bacterium]
MDIAELIGKAIEYIPPARMRLIEDAYAFAAKAHAGQLRLSGEPFLQHPLNTAYILTELQMDSTGLAAALLHDVVEDCGVPLSEIEERFGPDVARLVDGVTKLGKLTLPAATALSTGEDSLSQAENLRKMLVAMAQDLRVVLIKLADRLHNMRTLSALPPAKRRQIAQETIDIYAPLAHRLGIWQLKWQLEDLAFRHLEPQRYRDIARLVTTKRASRERYLAQVVRILREEFGKAGIKAEVMGRPKNLYSIKQKMDKYAAQGKDFSEIYDLLALRVLVPTVQDCYAALGVIHNLWRPLPNAFDDYVANPKDNMYQSLHTAVMCLGARPLEVQIRTYEMHRVAEYGIASHWTYKEGGSKDRHFEKKVAWLRQLMEWQRELGGAEEFVESVKTDIFQDRVFVYTPKGEIKDLPAGATPLDFAYLIHTDLGHYCIGAKVNGKLVPLNTALHSGDTAEILTAKGSRGPSLDWLNPNLGYLNTSHARQKVRVWFKRQ